MPQTLRQSWSNYLFFYNIISIKKIVSIHLTVKLGNWLKNVAFFCKCRKILGSFNLTSQRIRLSADTKPQ